MGFCLQHTQKMLNVRKVYKFWYFFKFSCIFFVNQILKELFLMNKKTNIEVKLNLVMEKNTSLDILTVLSKVFFLIIFSLTINFFLMHMHVDLMKIVFWISKKKFFDFISEKVAINGKFLFLMLLQNNHLLFFASFFCWKIFNSKKFFGRFDPKRILFFLFCNFH